MPEQNKTENLLESLRNQHLLITGGFGFLGRWVTEVALRFGAKITLVDRTVGKEAYGTSVTLIKGDIVSLENLDTLIKHCDAVVHLAGSVGTESTFKDLQATIKDNVVISTKVIESALRLRRRTVLPMVGNDWLNPYTISRKCAADLAIMANLECEGNFRVLKIMNAYGPWQKYNSCKKIVPTFIRQCMLNEPIEIFGDGNQCVDLIYAEDIAIAVLVSCVSRDLPNNRYIEVGTSIPYRVIEVANMIRQLTSSKSELRFVGKRKGEPLHCITLARDEILHDNVGYRPKVDLKDGLVKTIEWYASNPSCIGINK
jgi:nucleoside-diphosphate-sugar epimerase